MTMSTPVPCPIPEVEQALAPFIKSRQQAFAIRASLAKYLIANTPSTGGAPPHTHHLQLHNPPSLKAIPAPSSSHLPPTHRAYLRALQAKAQAQERYNALQTKLNDERHAHHASSPTETTIPCDTDLIANYIALLRQRARCSALRVIRHSLESLLASAPTLNHTDPKTLVTTTLGDQANLPSERLESLGSRNTEVDDHIFRLKKELLHVKGAVESLDRDRAAVLPHTPGRQTASLEDEVYALTCARDELVDWVEKALSRISDEDTELLDNASPIKGVSAQQTAEWDTGDIERKTKELYEKYTAARASIIKTLSSRSSSVVPTSTWPPSSHPADQPGSKPKQGDQEISVPVVQSYLQELMHTAEQERSLLEHTVYLQLKLSSATTSIEEALGRLSNESHLLSSSSQSLSAWTEASKQNNVDVENTIKEYLQENVKDGIHSQERLIELYNRLMETANSNII